MRLLGFSLRMLRGIPRRLRSALGRAPIRLGFPLLFALLRADEAFRAEADQVGAAGLGQRLVDEKIIFRVAVLNERALHCLFVRIGRHIDRLHRPRIKARVIHDGREGGRGGIKILHLLGAVAGVTQVFRQRNGLLQRRAGMTAHQIGNEILSFAEFFI